MFSSYYDYTQNKSPATLFRYAAASLPCLLLLVALSGLSAVLLIFSVSSAMYCTGHKMCNSVLIHTADWIGYGF